MESVIFKLKNSQKSITPAKQKETLISLIFSYGYSELDRNNKKKYIPLRYSTGIKVKPHHWNKNKSRVKEVSTYDYKSINTFLENLETLVKKTNRENPNLRPDELRILLKRLRHSKTTEKTTLNTYIDTFLEEIETGNRKTQKGTNYAKGTIKTYKNFKVTFAKFQDHKSKIYDFKDITINFYLEYTNFLSNNGANPNTVGKHVKTLKSIMRYARETNLHNNSEIDNKAFKVIKQKVENVYLSEDEIEKIYTLDLSNNKALDIARDVFLAGCYTAQRYSDYSKLTKSNIKKYDKTEFIELTQAKTKEKVIIPIRTELYTILKKYNFTLPKTHNQKVNKYIKEVCKLAEIDIPIDKTVYKNGLSNIVEVAKYKLITTHTARRSGATNMYLGGIPTIDIMKITGHTSESSFLKYILVTKQQTAQNLSLHPYFKSTNY